jgi:hypothetical protein
MTDNIAIEPTVVPVVPIPEVVQFTKETILKMSGPDLRAAMKNPESRGLIEEALKTVTPEEIQQIAETPEELAAKEAGEKAEADRLAKEAADKVEVDRLAAEALVAEKAEADKKAIEAKAVADAEAAKKKKFVVEYQATDESGAPIGNKTHLEATSQEELIEKMKTAHIQAVRAFTRLKNQKVTFKKEEPITLPMSDAERIEVAKDLKAEDPAKAADAVKKLMNEELDKERAKAREAEEKANGERVSYQFMKNHMSDFNPCEANAQIIGNYIKENNLAWTVDNLEIAFANVESQLAPREVPPTPQPVAVVQPVVEIPAAPVVEIPVAPVAVAPVVEPASVVPPPAARPPQPRPGVNTGVVPGESLSGARPSNTKPGLTMKDIAKMSADEFRKAKRDPAFMKQLEALGIKPQ